MKKKRFIAPIAPLVLDTAEDDDGEENELVDDDSSSDSEVESEDDGYNVPAGRKAYACDSCDKRYKRRNSLWQHQQSEHKARTYDCDVCGAQLKYPSSLRTHKEYTCPGETHQMLKCPVRGCRKEFKHKSSLDEHRRVEHEDGQKRKFKPKVCCNRTFNHKADYWRHRQVVHEKKELFKCDVRGCGMSFENAGLLRMHEKSHAGDIRCNICYKKFRHWSTLRDHVYVHTDGNTCPVSGCIESEQSGVGWTRSRLRKHMKKKHPNVPFPKNLRKPTMGTAVPEKPRKKRVFPV